MDYTSILDNLIIDAKDIIVPDDYDLQILYKDYCYKNNLSIDLKIKNLVDEINTCMNIAYVEGYKSGVEFTKNKIKESEKEGIK